MTVHGMHREASIEIQTSPDAVYDLVSDLPRMGEWSPEKGYVQSTCICYAWHIHVYLKYEIMPSYYLKLSSPPEKISFACLGYLT
jgi:hypothetical protein